jgi:polysaccharide deacetylase family protein (PEP-CTERM system associated)
MNRIANALTCDVEDYFQVSAFAPHIERSQWDAHDCRVERNVDRLLQLFARHGARGTFFTLGWIAERYPQLVRAIVAAGHELASHGYGHLRASEMSRAEFNEDIVSAKKLLEDIGGVAVHGYRAPSFSIGHANQWAFDALVEAGYRYSSSVYPVRHDHYGMPDAPRFPYRARPELVEIPVTTTRLFGNNVPTGGGGYFRFFPYRLSEWMIRRVNRVDGQPAIFYFHPWEIYPDQPRVPGVGLKTRFRHYVNLRRTEERLAQLLRDFRWERVDVAFASALGLPAASAASTAPLPTAAVAA